MGEMDEKDDGADDRFSLHDLKVEVVATGRPMVCDHREGEYFLVIGEKIVFPEGGRGDRRYVGPGQHPHGDRGRRRTRPSQSRWHPRE